MAKEKWAAADEIESQNPKYIDPNDPGGEVISLPTLTLDLANSDEIESESDLHQAVMNLLDSQPELKDKIESENLDIVAHEVKNKSASKWVLIIGFGFATIGLGILGYKMIKRHKQKIRITPD